MFSEVHRRKWIARAPEILAQNLQHVRPECGLDISILKSEPDIDPEVEVLVNGQDVAVEVPEAAVLPGVPRSIEEARRRSDFVRRQIGRVQRGQLIFGVGLSSGLVPVLIGQGLESLNGIVVFLERSLEQLRLAFRLCDLRTVLQSRDTFWCVGSDLSHALSGLFRREALYLIGRNRWAVVLAPGLATEESRYYQQVVPAAFQSVSADRSQVSESLFRPAVIPEKGPLRIWTYIVPQSFHEPIVRAIASGFRMNGHHIEVASLDASRAVTLRFIRELSKLRPDLLFLLNLPGADFARALLGPAQDSVFMRSVCRVSWFADNATFYANITRDSFNENDWVFWMDRSFEATLSSPVARLGGFLPVAASVTRKGDDVERFRHAVCFVGNIVDIRPVMESISSADRQLLLQQVDRLVCNEVDSPFECAREVVLGPSSVQIIEKAVSILRQNPLHGSDAVAYFLYVVANAEKRIRFLRPLIPLGLHVYGTDTWRFLLPELSADHVHGRIDIDLVPNLYRSCLVNVGLHSAQCPTCLNARDFDVLFSGGCLVADWVPDADAGLVEPGVHAVFVRDPETLRDTVAELLADESRRREMAEAGREHVLRHHTYTARTRQLLRRLKE